jgi:hypothetical protein
MAKFFVPRYAWHEVVKPYNDKKLYRNVNYRNKYGHADIFFNTRVTGIDCSRYMGALYNLFAKSVSESIGLIIVVHWTYIKEYRRSKLCVAGTTSRERP